MGLETCIKPISYLKAHSAEVFRELGEAREFTPDFGRPATSTRPW